MRKYNIKKVQAKKIFYKEWHEQLDLALLRIYLTYTKMLSVGGLDKEEVQESKGEWILDIIKKKEREREWRV